MIIRITILSLLFAQPLYAGERTFLIVFGSQSSPKVAWNTHSWITAVRADNDGAILAVDTISWLPATLKIRPLAAMGEPGVNLDLPATLAYARSKNERIALWGPYEVRDETYSRFVAKKTRLDAGELRYKAYDPDWYPNSDTFSNCFHVFTEINPKNRAVTYANATTRNGISGSHYLVYLLHDHGRIIGPGPEGLLATLDLCQPDIVRHAYRGSRFYLPGRD